MAKNPTSKQSNEDVPAMEQSASDKKLVEKYISHIFPLAWKATRKFFDRANEDNSLYEQELDLDSPSLSDITLGEAKKFVDQALPAIWFRLMGSENPFELIPSIKTIAFEKARKVRDWVLFNLTTVMGFKTEGYLTLKDAVKYGKGYMIIEPKFITPPVSDEKTVFVGNRQVKTRDMNVGKTIMVPGCTYIPFGSVIPTPDGKNPDEVSVTYVLRFKPEDEFRNMLDKKLNPESPFTGNADEIIKYARSSLMNGYVRSPRQIAAQIANKDRTTSEEMNNGASKDTPVSVPILCAYGRKEHVWFACDRFPIYHKKSKPQTLRSPLVVATFDPDGSSWFTPGIIHPRRRMIAGVESFYQAVMDILTMHLHPHQVVNRDNLVNAGESPTLQPYGKTLITGAQKAGDVVSWATPPALPSFLLEIGSRLEEFDTASVGQPKSLHGQGTAGLVRGGSGAMESLQQSTSGREKLAASHFENGFYTAVVEQALILCQQLANDKDVMPQLAVDATTGETDLKWIEITRDDIRQVYRVSLSFTEKMSNQLAELNRQSLIYDRGIQNPFVNKKEAFALLVGNTRQFAQLTSGVNVEENIRQTQAMAGKPTGAEAGSPPEIPSVAGAGASAGGLSQ